MTGKTNLNMYYLHVFFSSNWLGDKTRITNVTFDSNLSFIYHFANTNSSIIVWLMDTNCWAHCRQLLYNKCDTRNTCSYSLNTIYSDILTYIRKRLSLLRDQIEYANNVIKRMAVHMKKYVQFRWAWMWVFQFQVVVTLLLLYAHLYQKKFQVVAVITNLN